MTGFAKAGSRGVAAIAAAMLLAAGAEGVAHAQNRDIQQNLEDCAEKFADGEYGRAAELCDAAIKRGPAEVPAEGYARRAAIYIAEKKFDAGLAWLDGTALKQYPGSALLLEQKALMLTRLKRSDEAIKVAEEAAAANGKTPFAQRMLCDHYTSPKFAGNVAVASKATAACEAYLRDRDENLKKDDQTYLVRLGLAQTTESKFAEAGKSFDKALGINRDNSAGANARKGLCAVMTAQKEFDKAITICEDVLKRGKALRNDPSTYFNLGLAYLERKQLDRANANANAYIQAQRGKPQGYLLRGRIFFEQKKYPEAEGAFLRAAELKPSDLPTQIARGKNFLEMNQLQRAIDELGKAVAQLAGKVKNGEPIDDFIEAYEYLAKAYIAANKPKDAAAVAEDAAVLTGQPKPALLWTIGGDARLAAGDLAAARKNYAKAYELNPKDVKTRDGLANSILAQAAKAVATNDDAAAKKFLGEAYAIAPDNANVNFNLGIFALEEGRASDAVKYLQVPYKKTPNDATTNRLLGKAYMNLKDASKANEFFSKAEEEAKRQNGNQVLSEIYTDWAPLLIERNLEEGVTKLELAERYSSGKSWMKAAQRNLQVAYFRRGYERWKARRSAEALSDLEGAVRYPANLEKEEEDVYTFALGLAYLSAGQEAKALPIFQKYGKAGVLKFLKAPWDKFGADFFLAYAWYREGSQNGRKTATNMFASMVNKAQGVIGAKAKALLRSSYEFAAYEAFNRGSTAEAAAALGKAEGLAGPNERRFIDHNQAVLNFGKAGVAAFAAMGDSPPEALVNQGILADQAGDPKKAYDLWVAAKAKGARAPKLDEWINAKKRIYNF